MEFLRKTDFNQLNKIKKELMEAFKIANSVLHSQILNL